MSSDASLAMLAKGSVRTHWEVKKDWEVRSEDLDTLGILWQE
jgi:hypothetical protein